MDLNRTVHIPPVHADERALLDDIQGNIVAPHGRYLANHILLRFSSPGADNARDFIHSFRDRVTTATAQHTAKTSFQADPDVQGTHYGLGLSASCCRLLDVPDEWTPTDTAFLAGMNQRRHANGDEPENTSTWQPHLTSPHAIVIIADSREDALRTATTEVLDMLTPPDRNQAVVESGHWLPYPRVANDPLRVEHFGFAEGLSNPRFISRPDGALPGAHWDDTTFLDQILVPCGPSGTKAFGSYLVFRKLEQHVRRFWDLEQQLEAAIAAAGGSAGRAAAMAMGRFRSGTPLAQSGSDLGPSRSNDFDPFKLEITTGTGTRCPMHAHIRRANPRGELPVVYSPNGGVPTAGVSRRIPIARRGIPYGHRLDDPCDPDVPLEDRPTDGVGMLFMSMHSHIARQFEYVQRHWLGGAGTNGTIDPLVVDPISSGRAPPEPQIWPVEWASAHKGTVSFAFDSCVTLLGGEYFFLPPKRFLEQI